MRKGLGEKFGENHRQGTKKVGRDLGKYLGRKRAKRNKGGKC